MNYTKSNLKLGDIIITRNGNKYVFLNWQGIKLFVRNGGYFLLPEGYFDNLQNNQSHIFDIIKVIRVPQKVRVTFLGSKDDFYYPFDEIINKYDSDKYFINLKNYV